jgi:hypothetical protein
MSTTIVKPGPVNGITPMIDPIKRPYSDVWTMTYFKGGSPNQIKNFIHPGDFKTAHSCAKDYCAKMGYRLMYIKQFLSDLDAELNASKNNLS